MGNETIRDAGLSAEAAGFDSSAGYLLLSNPEIQREIARLDQLNDKAMTMSPGHIIALTLRQYRKADETGDISNALRALKQLSEISGTLSPVSKNVNVNVRHSQPQLSASEKQALLELSNTWLHPKEAEFEDLKDDDIVRDMENGHNNP